MSGVPLPVGDVATGTVTVRVIRGSLANVVPGQDVQLAVGGDVAHREDQRRRACRVHRPHAGYPRPGDDDVDGERLESQEFDVPAAGGVRLMLVAAAPASAAPRQPAAHRRHPGHRRCSLPPAGGRARSCSATRRASCSRWATKRSPGFYILQIVNGSSAPVRPAEVFTLDLPDGAAGAVDDAGLVAAGQRRRHQGGGGRSRSRRARPRCRWRFPCRTRPPISRSCSESPVPLAQVAVLVEKVGAMQLDSPQFSQHREVKAEADTYILGQGPGLDAGGLLTINVSGLPHHPLWPRNLALALAAVILGAGIWASARPGRAAAAESRAAPGPPREARSPVRRPGQRRGAAAQPARSPSDRYQTRRAELVRALERIYAELDEDRGGRSHVRPHGLHVADVRRRLASFRPPARAHAGVVPLRCGGRPGAARAQRGRQVDASLHHLDAARAVVRPGPLWRAPRLGWRVAQGAHRAPRPRPLSLSGADRGREPAVLRPHARRAAGRTPRRRRARPRRSVVAARRRRFQLLPRDAPAPGARAHAAPRAAARAARRAVHRPGRRRDERRCGSASPASGTSAASCWSRPTTSRPSSRLPPARSCCRNGRLVTIDPGAGSLRDRYRELCAAERQEIA